MPVNDLNTNLGSPCPDTPRRGFTRLPGSIHRHPITHAKSTLRSSRRDGYIGQLSYGHDAIAYQFAGDVTMTDAAFSLNATGDRKRLQDLAAPPKVDLV